MCTFHQIAYFIDFERFKITANCMIIVYTATKITGLSFINLLKSFELRNIKDSKFYRTEQSLQHCASSNFEPAGGTVSLIVGLLRIFCIVTITVILHYAYCIVFLTLVCLQKVIF